MKNYLAYKEEIQGFEEVSEAVKTVEKIAASSIVRCRAEMTALDMYQMTIKNALDRLILFHKAEGLPTTSTTTKMAGAKAKAGTTPTKALILLTSDKGLTGGLWRRMVDEFFKNEIQNYGSIVAIGAKGERYLQEENVVVSADTMSHLVEGFSNGLVSQIDILYPKFVSLSEHRPTLIPFLPFANGVAGTGATSKSVSGSPIIDPVRSSQEILERLMKKYADAFFKKILAETRLSEFSARTVSMEHAGNKTDELIKGLNLNYRKERRRVLTQKQLESFVGHRVK